MGWIGLATRRSTPAMTKSVRIMDYSTVTDPTTTLSPAWQEVHRLAKAIPPSVSPNQECRKQAIHAYWQAMLKALREERN